LLKNGDLASASADKTIKLWDTNEGTVKKTLIEHKDEVWALVELNNGDLVSGSSDVESGNVKSTLKGHASSVYKLSGDLVSGSNDKTIKIWNLKDQTLVRTLTGHSQHIFALKVLKNGDLVSGSYDNTIKVWDIKSGRVSKTISLDSAIYALEVLPNGDLVSVSLDGKIRIWE
jgi:WD40 repeat protein